jgi:hypothetical protein
MFGILVALYAEIQKRIHSRLAVMCIRKVIIFSIHVRTAEPAQALVN